MLSPSAPPEHPRQMHDWERIDVAVRRRIAARLRVSPQPWRFVLEQLLEEHPVKRQHLHSLIMTAVLYGPDDPFLLGERSLDDREHVDAARRHAEEQRVVIRREARSRTRKAAKVRKQQLAAEQAAQVAAAVEPTVRKRAAKAG